MALNLTKFLQPQWVFKSEKSGDWDVYFYSVNASIEVERFLEGEKSNPSEGVRSLMGKMCRTRVKKNGNENLDPSREPSVDELAAFSEEDINEFARQFLIKDATVQAIIKDGNAQNTDQPVTAHLLQLLGLENKKNSLEAGKILSNLGMKFDGLSSSKNAGIRKVSQDLMAQSEGLERHLGLGSRNLFSPPAEFKMPHFSPHPAHETNDRLGEVSDRLARLVEFGENALKIMNGLQIAAAEFLENFSKEAEKNSIAAKRAIAVGVLAILISFAQIAYTEFWRVPQDTASMDTAVLSIQSEIDELQAALASDLASTRVAEEETARVLAEAILENESDSTLLLRKIEQLLQEQSKRDEATIAALSALAEALVPEAE